MGNPTEVNKTIKKMMKCFAILKSDYIPSHENKSYSTAIEILPFTSVAITRKVKAILSFAGSEQLTFFHLGTGQQYFNIHCRTSQSSKEKCI